MGFAKKTEKKHEESLEDQMRQVVEEEIESVEQKEIPWERVPIISTGSTLLDLSISGGRTTYGGIPACILVEIHGPAGSGKTAILSEVGSSGLNQGLDVQMQDPEGRIDKAYSEIYGFSLDKVDYYRPSTVSDAFKLMSSKKPTILLTDSFAALTTELEIETGDKMGMRRAKEFSSGLRVWARTISDMLWVASNQERESDHGVVTPGGNAIGYYSSLRIRIKQVRKVEVEKELPSGVKVKKAIGIESECYIHKSTVDDPYRTAPIYIVFNYGIDDIRGNLQYIKNMKKTKTYVCPDGKSYLGMDQAIRHVEEKDLVKSLKNEVVMVWNEIEELFKSKYTRKKQRG